MQTRFLEEMERLDRSSQGPNPYPNSHHHRNSLERNPQLFPRYKAER